MKIALQVALIMVLCFLATQYFGWYAFVPVLLAWAFLSCYTPKKSAALGALSMLLLYGGLMLWSGREESWAMASKMALLFNISSLPIFISIHLLLAALLGALSSAAGVALRAVLKPCAR